MKLRILIFAVPALLSAAFVPRPASAQPRYTQAAPQCILQQDYPVGYNGSAYNFRRIYNTCNARLNVFVVGSNGATDFGTLLEDGFLVMQNNAYSGAPLLPTVAYACVWPGMPSNGFGSYPSFNAGSFYCIY